MFRATWSGLRPILFRGLNGAVGDRGALSFSKSKLGTSMSANINDSQKEWAWVVIRKQTNRSEELGRLRHHIVRMVSLVHRFSYMMLKRF